MPEDNSRGPSNSAAAGPPGSLLSKTMQRGWYKHFSRGSTVGKTDRARGPRHQKPEKSMILMPYDLILLYDGPHRGRGKQPPDFRAVPWRRRPVKRDPTKKGNKNRKSTNRRRIPREAHPAEPARVARSACVFKREAALRVYEKTLLLYTNKSFFGPPGAPQARPGFFCIVKYNRARIHDPVQC